MVDRDIKSLFLAYRSELQRYLARKLRDEDLAEDLTQETFLRLSEHNLGSPAAVIQHERSYLYRVAHHLMVDYIRRQRREQMDFVADEDLPEVATDAPTPEQTVFGRDELARAKAILYDLPARTRQVFIAVRIERMTYQEAAQHLGISESSVQKHLAVAVKAVVQGMRQGQES